jgi:hypothetical protein
MSKRKPFSETKVGQFLKEKLPDVVDKIGQSFPAANLLKIIVGEKLSPEEQARLDELLIDYEKEMYEMEIGDRKDARDMFKSDSSLQKIFAITFLIGYLILTAVAGWMVYVITVKNLHVPEWAIGFVGTIYGAMSAKVSTITDFLFGSSYRQEFNDKRDKLIGK